MNDVFSDANRMASVVREMFEALMRFGFDRKEAFALLLTLLSAPQPRV